MAFDEDPDLDEDGEPIFDPDFQSDREASPALPDDDWEGEALSPTPDADSGEDDAPKSKPRKRLIKKSRKEDSADESDQGKKRKGKEAEDGDQHKKIRKSKENKEERPAKDGKKVKLKTGSAEKLAKLARASKDDKVMAVRSGKRGDADVKEMWDSVAGGDSEDDHEGLRTREDDAFIDDTGVELDDPDISDDDARSIGDAPQAEEGEEDEELSSLFKPGKKRNRKVERTPEDTAMLVEQFMARLEVAAEEDAELNRQSKPAVNKLKMLPTLVNVLSKRQLQQEFLDRGILSVLKNWLEPLPDGSLPNMNIRFALLKILIDLPIDVELYERRDQLKKSGLGKVIMFLSRSDEETPGNKKLARDLVDKWSRPIFQKSTRYEDLRNYDEERAPVPRPQMKKAITKSNVGFESREGDDLDLVDLSQEPKPGQPGYRVHASRPEATPLNFVVRPASKIDPDEIRARSKQLRQDERRMKMNKKLQQLKNPKRKKLQAEKISVEGRNLVKFF